MKASEAKELVCPFIQDSIILTSNVEFSSSPANINCITTNCMAWKKARGAEKKFNAEQVNWCEPEGYKFIKYSKDNYYMICYKLNEANGYCQRLSNG